MLIEFAFVAPFFMLIFMATVEVAVTLFVDATLSGAAEAAARDIRTGKVQEGADPIAAFQDKLCDSLFGLVDCADVVFDVQKYSDFAGVDLSIAVDEEGNLVAGAFTPGDSGEITVVRVAYRWEFITPIVGEALAEDGSGGVLLLSTMVFENEQFELGG